MILKNITIQNLGFITQLSYEFKSNFNILTQRAANELSYAICFILNQKLPPRPSWIGADTKIGAAATVNGKEYILCALPNKQLDGLRLLCYDKNGKNATREYLYQISRSAEQDLCEVFSGREETVLLRFLRYENEDLYYCARELSAKTGGMSDLKVFRAYLKSFIKNFEPEILRDGKQLEMILEKNGRYAVRYRSTNSLSYDLSESEKVLFRYLCFLKTAEFWRGFEELRDMHAIKKPLIITNFLERLDESIDTAPLFERAKRLERQTFIIKRN